MSNRRFPCIAGVSIAVLVASAMGDPPRRKVPMEKPSTQPAASQSSVFASEKDMTPDEKKAMNMARYHVFRLKKKVQQKFLCPTCKGTGKLHASSWVKPRSGGLAHVEDGEVWCQDCQGGKVLPSPGFHAALSDYNRRKLDFEKLYPFAAPLKTGLESWLFTNIKDTQTVALLNVDVYDRLRAGAARPDDVYLLGVEAFNLTDYKKRPAIQAHLRMPGEGRHQVNLIIFYANDKLPEKLHDNSCFLVLGYNEGRTIYDTWLGGAKTAQVLTAVAVKIVGRQVLPPE